MASKVKLVQSDIASKGTLRYFTDVVKHALSLAIMEPIYKVQLESKNNRKDLSDLMKTNKFRKCLISHTYQQLIKGNFEHYVCLVGTSYMLQVKYRKGSMAKFDICGNTVLLYEVANIAVPTQPTKDKLYDEELAKFPEQEDNSV